MTARRWRATVPKPLQHQAISSCSAAAAVESQGTTLPYARQVRFETIGGMSLLFDPEPLDYWIVRRVRYDKDEQAGNDLDSNIVNDYLRYRETKHSARHGHEANKLVGIVNRYLPKGWGDFCERIPDLLQQARKIRRKARAKTRREAKLRREGRKAEGEAARSATRSPRSPLERNRGGEIDAGRVQFRQTWKPAPP